MRIQDTLRDLLTHTRLFLPAAARVLGDGCFLELKGEEFSAGDLKPPAKVLLGWTQHSRAHPQA